MVDQSNKTNFNEEMQKLVLNQGSATKEKQDSFYEFETKLDAMARRE